MNNVSFKDKDELITRIKYIEDSDVGDVITLTQGSGKVCIYPEELLVFIGYLTKVADSKKEGK